MKKIIFKAKDTFKNALLITAAGAFFGFCAKMADIYTTNLANVFSGMSVWIFICVFICMKRKTPPKAAANVFCFCSGMLCCYHITAHFTHSRYHLWAVAGWAMFARFTPVMAFICRHRAQNDVWARLIEYGIITAVFVLTVLFYDKVRPADIVLAILTGLSMEIERKKRKGG